jgi:O-antigen/teichoic acid export membrane protein
MNKTFISGFIKGIASRSAGTFFQVFIGVLSLSIAARFIPRNEFGVYVLILIIASVFQIVNSLTLNNISITKYITETDGASKYVAVNTSIIINIIVSTILIILAFFAKLLFPSLFVSNQLSEYIIFIPLIYLVLAFDQLFQAILQGFQLYLKMAISQILNSLIRIIFIVVFLIFLKLSIYGLFYATILSYLCSLTYQYLTIRIHKPFIFHYVLYRQMFRFGFPLGLNDVLGFIFLKTDRLLIGALLNPTGVAYYEIASKIPDSSRSMFNSFIEVYFPSLVVLFAQKRYREAEKVLNNSMRIISFLCTFFVLFLYLFQNEITTVLFSKKYIESAPAMPILMLALTIALNGTIMGTSLVALGQSDKPAKVNIIRAGTSVLINLFMIPIFGFMGAVYATLLSICMATPLNAWFLRKAKIKVEISQCVKPIVVLLSCSVALAIFGLRSVIIRLAMILLFTIICFLLAIIKKRDIRAFIRAFVPQKYISCKKEVLY